MYRYAYTNTHIPCDKHLQHARAWMFRKYYVHAWSACDHVLRTSTCLNTHTCILVQSNMKATRTRLTFRSNLYQLEHDIFVFIYINTHMYTCLPCGSSHEHLQFIHINEILCIYKILCIYMALQALHHKRTSRWPCEAKSPSCAPHSPFTR